MSDPDTEIEALDALARHYAHIIRTELGDDPDHSGPEDAAEALAEHTIEAGRQRLLTGDWRSLLED